MQESVCTIFHHSRSDSACVQWPFLLLCEGGGFISCAGIVCGQMGEGGRWVQGVQQKPEEMGHLTKERAHVSIRSLLFPCVCLSELCSHWFTVLFLSQDQQERCTPLCCVYRYCVHLCIYHCWPDSCFFIKMQTLVRAKCLGPSA